MLPSQHSAGQAMEPHLRRGSVFSEGEREETPLWSSAYSALVILYQIFGRLSLGKSLVFVLGISWGIAEVIIQVIWQMGVTPHRRLQPRGDA